MYYWTGKVISCHLITNLAKIEGFKKNKNSQRIEYFCKSIISNNTSFILSIIGSREIVSLAAISLGLINVGSTNSEASSTILQKLLESTPNELSDTHSRFEYTEIWEFFFLFY